MSSMNSPVVRYSSPVAVAGADARAIGEFTIFTKVEHPTLVRAKGYKGIDRNRKFVRAHRTRMKATVARFFKDQRSSIAKEIVDIATKSQADLAARVLANLNLGAWAEELPKLVTPFITAVAVDGGETTSEALGVMSDEVIALMRKRAEAWAENRAAELVTEITESTRSMLRATVTEALEAGSSPQELADIIEESYALSAERAMVIARTEMATADIAGSMESFRATPGVAGKQWITAGDDLVSDECQGNEQEGTVELEARFSSGDEAPPAHPNCRCDIVPVFDNEMEDS